MNPSDYVASYYVASKNPSPLRPGLTGTVECDVCVVGAGIAGTSAALHLAERGYRVILLEQNRVGWGASGRSGAQVIAGISCGQEKLSRLIGAADARRVWDMTVEGVDLMRNLIARHDIKCDWVPGSMSVAIKARQDADLHAELHQHPDQNEYPHERNNPTDDVRTLQNTQP
jgi:gamma-glutamylputrescine oxidase